MFLPDLKHLPHNTLNIAGIRPEERPKDEHVEGGQIDDDIGEQFERERPSIGDAQMQTPDDERNDEVAEFEQVRRHNGEQGAKQMESDEHVARAPVQMA